MGLIYWNYNELRKIYTLYKLSKGYWTALFIYKACDTGVFTFGIDYNSILDRFNSMSIVFVTRFVILFKEQINKGE